MPSSHSNPRFYSSRSQSELLAFVRICAHYFAKAAWLGEEELLGNAHRLRGIRGAIIHGRLDLSCPFSSAWELARVWPEATLYPVANAGHQGNPSMRELMLRAHAELAVT